MGCSSKIYTSGSLFSLATKSRCVLLHLRTPPFEQDFTWYYVISGKDYEWTKTCQKFTFIACQIRRSDVDRDFSELLLLNFSHSQLVGDTRMGQDVSLLGCLQLCCCNCEHDQEKAEELSSPHSGSLQDRDCVLGFIKPQPLISSVTLRDDFVTLTFFCKIIEIK